MGLCMADVMPRMRTGLENTIRAVRVSSWLYPLRSKTSDQQELFRCVRGWVCRPQNPVGAVLGVPTWSLIRRLVVFRIPAWNSFLEIGEAERCSRDPYMIVKLRCLPI